MPSSAARSAVPSLLVALLGGVELRAQVPEDPAPIADAIAAAERWLEDGGDRALDAERIVGLGFLAELRRSTNTWYEQKYRDGPLWGTPAPGTEWE